MENGDGDVDVRWRDVGRRALVGAPSINMLTMTFDDYDIDYYIIACCSGR